MTVKKIKKKLELFIEMKYSHYNAKFYANRRSTYIHLGLDFSLFSFEDYKFFLDDIDKFLSDKLQIQFERVDPAKLVISKKWKHDYIIRSRNCLN